MTRKKSNQWKSKGKPFDFSRRDFLKTSAGAVVGAGSLASPYVNAQAGVTLRFLN
ncbi:MAG: twin-arginine translocation signal domain-containing protein, partial [Candidatus Afipia apatlaquensis]|nr:twin-arginine translocation signal domain-containing protein [Candidatus Afipia apatlaquensis]